MRAAREPALARMTGVGLFRSEHARGAATLFSGAVISQAIAATANIVLARFFEPSEFGVLGLYVGLSGFLAVISSMRLEQAIMLPRSRALANDLAVLSIALAVLAGVIAFAAVLLWRRELAEALGAPALEDWLLLLPISVTLGGVTQAVSVWLSRQKRFPEIAKNRMLQSGSSAVAQLAGRDWHPAGGLVMGTLAGQAIGCAQALRAITRRWPARLEWRVRRSARTLVHRYRDFPLHSLPEALVGQCQALLTTLMIAKYWSIEANGQLLLAQRMMVLPLALATQATGQVMFQRLAEQRAAGGPIGPSLRAVWKRLAILATATSLAVYFLAEPAASILLGDRWASSGTMMRALLPQVALLLVFGPTSSIAVVVRRQQLALWTGAAGLAAKSLWLLDCAGVGRTPASAVLGASLIDAGQMIFLNAVIWRSLKRGESVTR